MPDKYRSRSQAWLRDELILALDLYKREGVNATDSSIEELSALLRSIPIEDELAADPTFRSTGSVARRLANYLYLDPDVPGGLAHGGSGVGEIWGEFADNLAALTAVAAAIRANLMGLSPIAPLVDAEMSEAEEGRLLTRAHVARERNRRLVAQKKAQVLAVNRRLECEACGFDFSAYGVRGVGFIECHHRVPVSELRPGQRTRLTDLSLVCANCHRIIHLRRPWLTVHEVRQLLTPAS